MIWISPEQSNLEGCSPKIISPFTPLARIVDALVGKLVGSVGWCGGKLVVVCVVEFLDTWIGRFVGKILGVLVCKSAVVVDKEVGWWCSGMENKQIS